MFYILMGFVIKILIDFFNCTQNMYLTCLSSVLAGMLIVAHYYWRKDKNG